MKDTPPEINAMIFRGMMKRTSAERFLMGQKMTATAREMVWASLSLDSEVARRAAFLRRFYGGELKEETIEAVANHRCRPAPKAETPPGTDHPG